MIIPGVYFYDKWNNFDGAIACLSILDVWILGLLFGFAGASSFKIFRLLRLAQRVTAPQTRTCRPPAPCAGRPRRPCSHVQAACRPPRRAAPRARANARPRVYAARAAAGTTSSPTPYLTLPYLTLGTTSSPTPSATWRRCTCAVSGPCTRTRPRSTRSG